MDKQKKSWGVMLWGLVPAYCVLFVLLSLSTSWSAPHPDEMTLLGQGAQVARGQVLFTGVQDFVLPLNHWLHGALYRLAGARFWVFRLVQALAWCAAWYLFWKASGGFEGSANGRIQRLLIASLGVLVLSSWVYSYHHWWGMIFMLLWLAAHRAGWAWAKGPRSWGWAAALFGLALCNQQAALLGLFFLVCCFLHTWTDRERFKALLASTALTAGALGAVFLSWALTGRFGQAMEQLVFWPLRQYKGEGGFNQTGFLESLDQLHLTGLGVFAPQGAARYLLILPLLLWLPALFRAFSQGKHRGNWALFLGLLLLPVLFALGRQDWIHAMFLFPLLLAALMPRDRPAEAPALQRPWMTVALGLLLLGFALGLAGKWRQPVFPHGLHGAEQALGGGPLVSQARVAADINGGDLAVLGRGGMFEFFGVPSPLGRMLYLPPEARYNAPEELEALAAWIDQEKPRHLLIYPEAEALGLARKNSPLAGALQGYRPHKRVLQGLFLERRDAAP